VAAADYAFPWDSLIIDFKFHQAVELAQPLAAMTTAAVRATGGAGGANLVVPVPLAAQRLAERGFNQAWELARRVARSFGLPADAMLLQRPIETAHQADLPRGARALNLRGAFMVDPLRRAQVAGRQVALVDDVLTTGATAREAALALLRAGAVSVQIWSVARTP
jgi:ComF family protein